MPFGKPSLLRVHGQGGVRLADVCACLESIENAYNAAYVFESLIGQAQRVYRSRHPFYPESFWWGGSLLVPMRGGGCLSWPPKSSQVASLVTSRNKLQLYSVRLESPGFWDFLGKLNPLEVIRQYLQDRHERRKDRDYREPAERQRLDLENDRLALENQVLENKVMAERIEIARGLGATGEDLTPIFNELIFKPLRKLERHQDRDVIDSAEIIALPSPNGEGGDE